MLALVVPLPNAAWAERGPAAAQARPALTNGALFADSGQALGDAQSQAVGDVDGDGDVDAVVVNSDVASRVWINQGGAQGGQAGQ